tara:strand:- start:8841 stop:11381 length:2541 start_codon:yes stop_codon:yes gene_type:complete
MAEFEFRGGWYQYEDKANDRIMTIAVFGVDELDLETTTDHRYSEFKKIDTICNIDDSNVEEIINKENPDVLCCIGSKDGFSKIQKLPKYWKDKCLYFDDIVDDMGNVLAKHYIKQASNFTKNGLISVFTAAFNIKTGIYNAYNSLREQTYTNWEWVIYDDSNDGETWDILTKIADNDFRVRLYRGYKKHKVTSIGHNKFIAASNCHGEFILELDDDDFLIKNCLEEYIYAFNEFPDAGFAFSDWVERDESTGEHKDYGEGWGFGYGKRYQVSTSEGDIWVHGAPNVNPLSIRKLWSSLNHPKAWRKDVYMKIGGHNPNYAITDDYDMIVRTFLATKMIHIPRFHYVQLDTNIKPKDSMGNKPGRRGFEIQRHVRLMQEHYDEKIKDRFKELGVKDWTWNDELGRSNINLYFSSNPDYDEDTTELSPKYGDEEGYVNYISTIGQEVKPIPIWQLDRVDKKVKIVMNCMFGDESKVVRRMLDSVTPYIDYFVIQCNGNDDTKNKVERWSKETGIPGLIYQTEWKYPGWNRNDTLQKCLSVNHGCDFILRMDADEILEVDKDFDWEMLFQADSWTVPTFSGNVRYNRTWLWSTKLDWYFALDKRHETIHCDNKVPSLGNLPESFRHVLLGGGDTWTEDYKFIKDALELEKQVLEEPDNFYHLFMVGKSYYDSVGGVSTGDQLPYGKKHNEHYEERMVWHLKKYMEKEPTSELSFYSCLMIGQLYRDKDDWDEAMKWFVKGYHCCPDRNETIMEIVRHYYDTGEHDISYRWSKIAIENKFPFPGRAYILHFEDYPDKSYVVYDTHVVNCYYSGNYEEGIKYAKKLLENPFGVNEENVRMNIRLCKEKLNV